MISVVIPVYNYNFIDRAVNSIINYSNNYVSEIIIIIDRTDIKPFKFDSDRLSIKIHQNIKNLGPGPSRNIGILLSSNEYISFLDADDIFTHERSFYYEEILKSNSLVFCSNYIMNEKLIISEDKNTLYEYLSNTNICLSTVTCKKELFYNYGLFFPSNRTRQDTRWLISVLNTKLSIKQIDASSTVYWIHENQISKNKLSMVLKVFLLYVFELEIGMKGLKYFFKYCKNSFIKHFK